VRSAQVSWLFAKLPNEIATRLKIVAPMMRSAAMKSHLGRPFADLKALATTATTVKCEHGDRSDPAHATDTRMPRSPPNPVATGA
jgi:hypothetical protein